MMDRRSLLAMVLCFAIFVGWNALYGPKSSQQASVATTAQTEQAAQSAKAAAVQKSKKLALKAQVQKKPKKEVRLQTALGDVALSSTENFFSDFRLKDFQTEKGNRDTTVDLNTVTHLDRQLRFAVDDASFGYLADAYGDLRKTDRGAVWTYSDDRIELKREFVVSPDQPYVDVTVRAKFKAGSPKNIYLMISSKTIPDDSEVQDRVVSYYTQDAIESERLGDADFEQVNTQVRWIGASSRYFLFAVVNRSSFAPAGLVQPTGENKARVSLVYPVVNNEMSIPVRVFFGPKKLEVLKQVDERLESAVDLGWFTVFGKPLLQAMNWFYRYVGNYGIAIIILTLILKTLMYPLTYKSMKSMKQMSKLQPKIQRLRDKYGDDREALNREMMTLMKKGGYNPMAGCLPMLIQIPVFIAFYRVLYSSIELYQAPFYFYITDLSTKDPYYVTPILLGLLMFLQQKLTPNTATDPMQAKMLQFMPLMFTLFMLTLPSGLTLYMLVNSAASILQQMILNKKLDGEGQVSVLPA